MCRRDLHAAGTEGRIHVIVGDDRHAPADNRQYDLLAHQLPVSIVVRVHSNSSIAQHGLRPRCCDHEVPFARGERVTKVPQVSVFFLLQHFEVGKRRVQNRVPVDQPLAAVDQALLMQPYENLGHRRGQIVVHGESVASPVDAGAHATQSVAKSARRIPFSTPIPFRQTSRGRALTRLTPCALSWRSTTIWVAIPAWSVPGCQSVFRPSMR